MKRTENLNLPLFDGLDKFNVEEINNANKALDAKVFELQDIVNSASMPDIAVAREVNGVKSSLADIATNVKTFGAIGDGVTDDTAAIQSAINFLSNGGKVFFPKGVYIVSNRLILKDNTTIEGDNAEIKLINGKPITVNGSTDWFGCTLIWCENVSNITIKNININGNQTNQLIATDGIFNGIMIKNCERIYVENCYIHDMQHGAIKIAAENTVAPESYKSKGVYSLSVKSNRFRNVQQALQITESNSKDIIFTNNDVNSCYSHGISTYPGVSYITITNNIIKNVGLDNTSNGSCIRLFETVQGVVANNIVENPRVHAIYVNTNTPILFQKSKNIAINNNTVLGGGRKGQAGDGIAVIGDNISISNNSIYDFTNYTYAYAIRISGDYCNATANIINNSKNGIAVNGKNIVISNNSIADMETIAIGVGLNIATSAIVSNNIVMANTTPTNVAVRLYSFSDKTVVSGNKSTLVNNEIVDEGTNTIRVLPIYYKAAIPTTGSWKIGDIIYNSTPVLGGFIGWVCVTAGTPGVWKGFGSIAS